MEKETLKVNKSIIRITGIFESDGIGATERKLKDAGYKDEIIDNQQFHKNYWYPEFRDIFFRKESFIRIIGTLNLEIFFFEKRTKRPLLEF
jgi:hypothetical protein